MRKEPKIHVATAERAAEISEFVKRMLAKLYPAGAYNPNPIDLERLEESYGASKKACFYVAENQEGRIVGTAAVRPYDHRFPELREVLTKQPICEMTRFYLDDRYRRRGIGGALYEKVEAFARQAGYQESYLHTSVYLPGGYPFWASRGYEERYWETDQIVHMSKFLSNFLK